MLLGTLSLQRIKQHPIISAIGLRNHEKLQRSIRQIHHLVRHVGRNCRAFKRMQLHVVPVDFQGGRPGKNKEELIGLTLSSGPGPWPLLLLIVHDGGLGVLHYLAVQIVARRDTK